MEIERMIEMSQKYSSDRIRQTGHMTSLLIVSQVGSEMCTMTPIKITSKDDKKLIFRKMSALTENFTPFVFITEAKETTITLDNNDLPTGLTNKKKVLMHTYHSKIGIRVYVASTFEENGRRFLGKWQCIKEVGSDG